MLKVAIIGRTQWLYETVRHLVKKEYSIPLIATAPAAPEYTKKEDDFEKLASDIGTEFYFTKSLNNLESLKKNEGLDIAVSMNWPTIIQQKHIDYFRLGILNAHMGDLPRYRGNASPNWAIINGEKEITISIHLMEAGKLDCGRVIVQEKMSISENTYIGDVYVWAEQILPDLFIKALMLLERDPDYTLKYADPRSSDSLRCYPRIAEDGRINWKDSAEKIHRLIHASSEPFGGAFCKYGGKKFIIWKANIYKDDEKYCAVPGQIVYVDKNEGYAVVTTGKGKLKLHEIEFESFRGQPSKCLESIRKRLK